MLGKLLKYEFKDLGKLFLPLNAIVLAIAVLWAATLAIGIDGSHLGFISTSLMILYVFGIMALFIITAVYLAIRFYKTMYGSQGYLTHTLPAVSSSIVNAKVIAALAWLFLALLICLISILILMLGISGFPDASDFNAFQTAFGKAFGTSAFGAACLIIAVMISFCFDMSMMVFASLSIGQLFSSNRIPAAIGAGVVCYVIQQAISSAGFFILGLDMLNDLESDAGITLAATSDFNRYILLASAGVMFLFGVVYYVICFIITKKKLNLE